MDYTILAPWRDAAIILLAIEAMVIGIVPLVASFYLVKGVRAVKRSVRPVLVNAQLWTLRIQRGITRTMDSAASVPIAIASRATLYNATTRGVINFLLGK